MKKVISILLSILMIFAMTSVAFAAETEEIYPTIYIQGYGFPLMRDASLGWKKENFIYPTGVDAGERIKEALEPCLIELAAGLVTDDYDAYCDELYNAIAPIYDELRLDKNGNARNNTGYGTVSSSYGLSTGWGFTGKYMYFGYDWRISVEENAALLEQVINVVCKQYNVQKVNLLGRCLGGNIVNAYLQNASNLDKINDVILYIPSTMGIGLIGALFSGNIIINDDAVENYGDYFLSSGEVLDDPVVSAFAGSLVEILNYAKVLGLGTDALSKLLEKIKGNLIPRLVRDTYGSFPSFWAMVPPEQLEEAVEFCYGTDELKAEYAGMIDKIMSYYKNVQLNAYDTMKAVQEQGIDIMVVSKYNIPNIPLSGNGLQQSDGTAETAATSFGSVSPEYGKTFDQAYINGMTDTEKKYLSPDLKVDASGCLFPETTWFVKNSTHKNFPDNMNDFFNLFLLKEEMDVFTDDTYPQFLTYDEATGNVIPVEGMDEPEPEKGSGEERFSVIIRFFTALFNFIANLLKGNVSFDFDIDL